MRIRRRRRRSRRQVRTRWRVGRSFVGGRDQIGPWLCCVAEEAKRASGRSSESLEPRLDVAKIEQLESAVRSLAKLARLRQTSTQSDDSSGSS